MGTWKNIKAKSKEESFSPFHFIFLTFAELFQMLHELFLGICTYVLCSEVHSILLQWVIENFISEMLRTNTLKVKNQSTSTQLVSGRTGILTQVL